MTHVFFYLFFLAWAEDRPTYSAAPLVLLQHKDMNDVVAEFPTKSHADMIEFYYNWKFHEPDYSRWQCTKRQIDIILVSIKGSRRVLKKPSHGATCVNTNAYPR